MDYGKKTKPKGSSCLHRGPGPQYQLKTLTGFDDHDPSRYRNPAYTMKSRPKSKLSSTGPGPYPITHHLTHRGLELPPAYTMSCTPHKTYFNKVPGPGAYAPEKCPPANHERRAASYPILSRRDKTYYKVGPGPIYMLPTCIGPEIPDIRAEGAFSMALRHKSLGKSIGPGPAAYNIELNVFKKQYPAYSIKDRHELDDLSKHIPGPGYSYNLNVIKKRQPAYSFGVRHSECTTVPITENDEI